MCYSVFLIDVGVKTAIDIREELLKLNMDNAIGSVL